MRRYSLMQQSLVLITLFILGSDAWSPALSQRSRFSQPQHARPDAASLHAQASDTTTIVDEEAPAGIGGAEFFGGNTEKQEFYDPIAEAAAGAELEASGTLARFSVASGAFDSEASAHMAQALQQLYTSTQQSTSSSSSLSYAPSVVWESPLRTAARSPLEELTTARSFYRHCHVAVTSAKALVSTATSEDYQVTWEISLVWPVFWEPRILLTGSSVVTISKDQITRQVDTLDQPDLLANMIAQWLPRFWDVYHIGMTPSAELSPRFVQKSSPLASYQQLVLPARWYLQATLLDLWDRDEGTASTIPNHAFATAIKTMGPQKQEYTPCSPVQVSILSKRNADNNSQQRLLQWHIPVAVETLAANTELPLPGEDPEMTPDAQPEATYVFVPPRKVAIVPYAGQPQDADISRVRKRLYDSVVKDGLTPKVDAEGRPLFFFWQETTKACYVAEGLGMAVYEWRPDFAMPSRVGIELE